MIEFLAKYYQLKQKELYIKQEIKQLRNQIIEELHLSGTNIFTDDNYKAEIKFTHELTPEFIKFLRDSSNTQFIKESASVDAYKILKDVYHFTEEEQNRYYQLTDTPHLYVKKLTK
ncbi:hypothetical protein AN641_05940 [Candidatus Epulonipiscioides gigas]|nr:hypothetical protein AN641_05940 [Epulopiscium sp. SCG-C07WGA-EpuloA2]